MTKRIGMVHPGAMGASVAAAAQAGGQTVLWAAQGRSPASVARAEAQGLVNVGTLAALGQQADIIVSVVPPHAAEAMAQAVALTGFQGLYVDANAIAPERATRMGASLAASGITLVDGAIMGPPAWNPNTTRLVLSGPRAGEIAALFAGSPLLTEDLGPELGRASALKMCYAAYSKGTTALLCAVLATAEQLGVRPALFREWARDDAGLPEQATQRARTVTAKAWRFVGEMDEIAATFRSAGLPGEFHAAASEIYARLAGFKEQTGGPPSIEAVLAALAGGEEVGASQGAGER